VSQEISEDVVAEALSRGAIGYLLKSDEGSDLQLAGKQRPNGFANTTDDPTITDSEASSDKSSGGKGSRLQNALS
jgi:hypothetical protein